MPELCQAQISKVYDKKVHRLTFEKDDFVSAVRRPMVMTHEPRGERSW